MDQGFCISKIYDAATSDVQWEETMDVITSYAGAKAGIVFSTNMHLGGDWHSLKGSHLWREAPPEKMQYIAENFRQYEQEAFEEISQYDKNTVHHDADVWGKDTLNQRADITYYRNNFGLSRRLASRLSDHPNWMESLALQYDQKHELVPASSQQAMSGIVQHVSKVVELNRSFALLEQRYQAVLMALDNIHIGVCIAQRNGEIIISNQEADRILDAKDALWLSPAKKLSFREPQQSLKLQQAIELAVGASIGEGTQVETLMHAERPSAQRDVLIEVAPISDGLREIQNNFQGALIYLIDPENPAPIKIERLAISCGLSGAESAVCERVAHGWKNSDIAEDRNVSLDTIKTQVAHVLSKTGVANRSELIRLILKSSPPIG